MQNYRKSSHATYDFKYHLVWITKYRKPILGGKIGERTRELVRIVCKSNEVRTCRERSYTPASISTALSFSK